MISWGVQVVIFILQIIICKHKLHVSCHTDYNEAGFLLSPQQKMCLANIGNRIFIFLLGYLVIITAITIVMVIRHRVSSSDKVYTL